MYKRVLMQGLVVTTLITVFLFVILIYRYSPDQRFTVFFVNKTIADIAIVLIGLSYLLGPLCKIIPGLSKYLFIRRYLGIYGFGAVVLHIIASLMQLNGRFPFKWYLDHSIAIIAVIIATVIFLVLTVTSTQKALIKLGGKTWKTIQRIGYIALILSLLHVALLANTRWGMWFAGEVSMPMSFGVFVFGILVLITRILAYIIDTVTHNKGYSETDNGDTLNHGI